MSEEMNVPSRRSVLRAGLAGAAGLTLGGLGLSAPAAAHGTIANHTEIAGARLIYEVNGAGMTAGFNPTFYNRLETWANFFYNNTPASWGRPSQIWNLGAHYDGRVSTAHNSGRGFDLTRIYVPVNGTRTMVCDARYNVWRSSASIATIRKRYWAASASLNYHFRNVLHYSYNSDHWNHFHIDNLVSGAYNSTFSTGSSSQVKHVQACCRYIWGYSTAIDGVWGTQTDTHSRAALRRMGRSGGLTTSQANWLAFNQGSTQFGTGRRTY